MIIIKHQDDIKKIVNPALQKMTEEVYEVAVKEAVADSEQHGLEFGDLLALVIIEEGSELFSEKPEAFLYKATNYVLHAFGVASVLEYVDERVDCFIALRIISDDGFSVMYIIPKSLVIPISIVMPLLAIGFNFDINQE